MIILSSLWEKVAGVTQRTRRVNEKLKILFVNVLLCGISRHLFALLKTTTAINKIFSRLEPTKEKFKKGGL
jgi:hypothetical protein